MAGLKNYSCWVIDIILKHCHFFFPDNKEKYILQKNIMTSSFSPITG